MKLQTTALVLVQGLFGLTCGNRYVKEIILEDRARLQREGFLKEEKPDSVLGQPQDCVDNKVVIDGEVFDCENIDFLSYLSLKDLEIEGTGHPEGFRAADIWGWVGPSGREFTLIGLDNGAAVVDTNDPENPCVIAKMKTSRTVHIWADVKVYNNTMYHVKDRRGPDGVETQEKGIEVYDLLPLDQLDCHVDGYVPLQVAPNYIFPGHGQCHNLVVNIESGLLYSVGADKCEGGFMMHDVKTNRLEPKQIMCADGDGYTHDGQCVIYDGPDTEHYGKEICFGFNEDTLTIWDFSDISNPRMLSRTYYPNQGYTHQGWLNDDMSKVLLDDELDEMCNSDNPHPYCETIVATPLNGLIKTSTDVFDVTDLDAPIFEGAYVHKDISVDHNLYIWGTIHRKGWGGSPPMEYYPDPNYAYLNNYLAGVRVLDIRSKDITEWFEAGYFDIAPDRTELAFAGAWSGYLHPSGAYAVSSIERGLFMLKPRMAYTEEFPQGPSDDSGNGMMIALIVLLVLLVVLMMICLGMQCSAMRARRRARAVEAEEKRIKAMA